MNEIVNTFLLAGAAFMTELHLQQPGFPYSACGPFTKNKERIKKIKEAGESRYVYQNELEKACFQHGMPCGDFKDLNRGTAADKVLRDKAFNMVKIQSMMDISLEFLQWFIIFLIRKILVVVLKMKIFLIKN